MHYAIEIIEKRAVEEDTHKLQGFQSTNRAKHNLKIYLILVCKYRKRLLVEGLDKTIKEIIIESSSDLTLLRWKQILTIVT